MKNHQLYKLIEDLIAEKKKLPIDISSETFAENYCRKQIIKRKLLPYDPNFKMNRIMRNFQGLQTYISLQEILSKMRKDQKNKGTNRNSDSHNAQQQTLQKQTISLQNLIKQKMSSFSFSKTSKQLQQLEQILHYLEKNSSVHSQLLKNNSNFLNCDIFDERHRKSCQQQQDSKQICFKNRLTTIQQNIQRKSLEKRNKSSQILSNSIKKRQLLFKMSTYLQIILQNQHHRKWNKQNFKTHTFHDSNKKSKFPMRNNSNFSSQCRKENQFLKKSLTSFFMTSHNRDSLRKQQAAGNSTNHSKSRFNRINPKPKKFKEIILNKLSSFINEIEDEEFLIKQKNKKNRKQLDKAEKKMQDQNSFIYCKQEPLAGQQDIEDIKKMANLYRKRKIR